MKRLVIKDDPTWEGQTPFVKVGWRIGGPGWRDDGSDDPFQDVMWGLGPGDDFHIRQLLADCERKYGKTELIDLRGQVCDVEMVDF